MKENLLFWNPWWKKDFDMDSLKVKTREIKGIKQKFQRKEILVITGVRRSGKTSMIYLLIKSLLKTTKPNNILYINLDDPFFEDKTLDEMYSNYIGFMKPETKKYIFLDEIQNKKDWEKWIKKMYDSFEDIKITVSGSTSHLLKSQYAHLLTGRTMSVEIYPLSFIEFLNFKGILKDDEINETEIYNKKDIIKYALEEYIEFGGFPEVVLEEDTKNKIMILKEYFETIRDRDIIKRFSIRDVKKIERLSLFLASNISKPISAKKIGSIINLNTSTVEQYFDYLSMSYLFIFLNHFSYSLKDQITYPRKVYCIDTGLRNAVSFRFSKDYGQLYENAVAIELMRRNKEIYYWKDYKQSEADFVVKEGLDVKEVIQVCYEVSDPEVKKREVKGLINAMDEFNLNEGILITKDYEDIEIVKGKEIKYIPLWKWLIMDKI